MLGREQLHCPCAVCAEGSNPDWIPKLLKHGIFSCCTQLVKFTETYRVDSWKEITYLAQQPIHDQSSVKRDSHIPLAQAHFLHIFLWKDLSSYLYSYLLILVLNLLDLAPVIETMANVWLEPFLTKQKQNKQQINKQNHKKNKQKTQRKHSTNAFSE